MKKTFKISFLVIALFTIFSAAQATEITKACGKIAGGDVHMLNICLAD